MTNRTEATMAELGTVSGDETLAEMQGMTAELGEGIARLAEEEIEAGHLGNARTILEGLVVTNHRDADAWALLSVTHRRLSQPLAARFCAEVAARLAPDQSVGALDARGKPAGSARPARRGAQRARGAGAGRRGGRAGPVPADRARRVKREGRPAVAFGSIIAQRCVGSTDQSASSSRSLRHALLDGSRSFRG